ncbi:Ig kappa chain V-II region 17S29.1 [Labeo rohita]|uniref:Ig kappa chain V-II region 17S29.1 n=1 Tax=Labeo rohita TaxID=84645 RepID=A0ABQ8LHU5_LABRO|nr:Ig kappa chain V-II region 17S29.1 [Labeo rohita]
MVNSRVILSKILPIIFLTDLLAYCQVEEILTYQLTDLGQNVTINCSLDLTEVTWLLLNSPDPPVLILRSFSNPPDTFYFNNGFKEKYSVQSKHNLFIKNVSIDELGVYYCTNIDRTAQFSNGTRLDQTTPITVPTPVSECLCQNHTVVEQSTDPTLWKTASVIFSLINVCLVFGFIDLLACCQVEEILTYQLTDLGQNVTINCGLDLKEVTWLLLNSPDPPVLILRSFSNSPETFYFNNGFKEKYSVQSKHNLFIKDVSIDELGVYYCTNIDRTAQFRNGTRLDQTTPITVPTPVSECLCQNHTVVEQSTDPTLWQTATVVFSLINVFLVSGFIGELDLLPLNVQCWLSYSKHTKIYVWFSNSVLIAIHSCISCYLITY